MTSRPTPVLAASTVILLAMTLSACAVHAGSAEVSASPPTPIASATAAHPGADTLAGSAAPADLTFGAGARLSDAWHAEWIDGFMADAAFEVARPDKGDGRWAYAQRATGCVVGFWQTALGPQEAGLDDRQVSDALLAADFGTDRQTIAPHASDDWLPYRIVGDKQVQTRSVGGSDPETGARYLVTARGFERIGVGLLTSIDCPASQDPAAIRAEIADRGLRVSVTPSPR